MYPYIAFRNRKFPSDRKLCIEEAKGVVESEIRKSDAKREQETFRDNHGDEPDPDGRGQWNEPYPERATDGVRRHGRSERAREQKSLLEEVTNNRNRPEERKVPHLAADRIGNKGDDGERWDYNIERHFPAEVERGDRHGQ